MQGRGAPIRRPGSRNGRFTGRRPHCDCIRARRVNRIRRIGRRKLAEPEPNGLPCFDAPALSISDSCNCATVRNREMYTKPDSSPELSTVHSKVTMSDLIARDIDAYLRSHQKKSLLRFMTCGSVDDGKSTLIGRFLYESKLLFEDQLAALEADSKKAGTQGGELDFALLLDGLAAEREQGITIDVAYRYFSTERRKYIVADTPGHEQYTRNMVTGASTADAAVILVDARKGVLTQTRRHSYLVSLLGIRRVVLAINKMDLVDFSADVFASTERDYRAFAARLGFTDITC